MDEHDELLPHRIELLRERSDQISEALIGFQKLAVSHARRRLEDNAQFSALLSIVKEIALQHGLSSDQFEEHYEARRAYFHDRLLQHAEKVSPEMAADIDVRPISQVSTGHFPPLFDED